MEIHKRKPEPSTNEDTNTRIDRVGSRVLFGHGLARMTRIYIQVGAIPVGIIHKLPLRQNTRKEINTWRLYQDRRQ